MEIVLVVIALIALGWAAGRWGVDSTDGFTSEEWMRRHNRLA